jgi:hypothetical protein
MTGAPIGLEPSMRCGTGNVLSKGLGRCGNTVKACMTSRRDRIADVEELAE